MQSFYTLHQKRRKFLRENQDKDFVVISGSNNILISAPHGVFQTRLGKTKFPEPGSLASALFLKAHTNCFFIAKTKNNFDDANFDEKSDYKDKMKEIIEKNNIKFVLDFHGLARSRPVDTNLGTNLGKNIEASTKLFDQLLGSLRAGGFTTQIDSPFMGGYSTIAGSMKKWFPNLWTLQIEINSSLTIDEQNTKKWNDLLNLLLDFIHLAEKYKI